MAGRVLIFGGRGFVGTGIAKEALKRNLQVTALSRTIPADKFKVESVDYDTCDVLNKESLTAAFEKYKNENITAVVCSIGSPPLPFVDKNYQIRMNGDTCTNVIDAAEKSKIPRFVLINAQIPKWVPKGYQMGKFLAEQRAMRYGNGKGAGCCIIKPSAVMGTRTDGPMGLPFPTWLVLYPLRIIFGNCQPILGRIEAWFPFLFWNVLQPPVKVEEIALMATDFIVDEKVDNKAITVLASHLYQYESNQPKWEEEGKKL